MSVDGQSSEAVSQDRTLIRRELHRDGRMCEVEVSTSADERMAVELNCVNEDGELISRLAGEISREDLAISAEVLHTTLRGLAFMHEMPGDGKAYTVTQKRLRDRNAYAKWTDEDEERLRDRHRAGITIAELSGEFGRNEGGIRARLVKLGELQPDADDGVHSS